MTGILMKHYNEEFKKYHKLTLSILKELGFGSKDSMERKILTEVDIYVNTISSLSGQPFDPERLNQGGRVKCDTDHALRQEIPV